MPRGKLWRQHFCEWKLKQKIKSLRPLRLCEKTIPN